MAGVETIIAAVNPVADQGPEFERDRALQFNGEVGDAPA